MADDCIECGQYQTDHEFFGAILCQLIENGSGGKNQFEGISTIKYCDDSGNVQAFGAIIAREEDPSQTFTKYFGLDLSEIAALPPDLSVCSESKMFNYPFEGCFETENGRVKLEGTKIVDGSNNISYHLTVVQSTDSNLSVLDSVTDISDFTAVDCLCDTCNNLSGSSCCTDEVVRLDGSLDENATPFINFEGGSAGNSYTVTGKYKSLSIVWLPKTQDGAKIEINDISYQAGISCGTAGYSVALPCLPVNGSCYEGEKIITALEGAYVEILITR